MTRYIYATDRSWTLHAFARRRSELPGDWVVVTSSADLKAALEVSPARYVFFPHWSHIVPKSILERVECVCFHMTDVPYGRGGSPLQNLIVRGHKETRLTALQMTEDLDAGPVYEKLSLSLAGNADEIFARMSDRAFDLMKMIVKTEPEPQPQDRVEAETFKRRTKDQSVLPTDGDLEQIYDHIRMLDADGYPHAFVDHGTYRILFRDSKLHDEGCVTSRVEIVLRDPEDEQ